MAAENCNCQSSLLFLRAVRLRAFFCAPFCCVLLLLVRQIVREARTALRHARWVRQENGWEPAALTRGSGNRRIVRREMHASSRSSLSSCNLLARRALAGVEQIRVIGCFGFDPFPFLYPPSENE